MGAIACLTSRFMNSSAGKSTVSPATVVKLTDVPPGATVTFSTCAVRTRQANVSWVLITTFCSCPKSGSEKNVPNKTEESTDRRLEDIKVLLKVMFAFMRTKIQIIL